MLNVPPAETVSLPLSGEKVTVYAPMVDPVVKALARAVLRSSAERWPAVKVTLRYTLDLPRVRVPVNPRTAWLIVPSKSLASCRADLITGVPANVVSCCRVLRDGIFQKPDGCEMANVPEPPVTV